VEVRKVTLEDANKTYCCMQELPPGASWDIALPESRRWFKEHFGKHVHGFHLYDGDRVVGHIYYAMSENALAPFEVEQNVAFINCTEMLRNYMHKGYGKTLLDHMKKELKKQGVKGILVVGTDFKEYMHHSHFAKQGFKTIKELGPFKLMYHPLNKESIEVKPLELNYKPSRDKVEVTLFKNFFCPVSAYMHTLVKKVARSFGDKVKIVEIDGTLENIRRYGTTDPLFNGKIKIMGPGSEEDVRKAIQEEIDQFKSS